jgi:two-component system response regulator YesN
MYYGKDERMYRLLIIDDEPMVREGIKILVPWDEYGFESISDACDGKEGLKKVLEFFPDLVLVDIKMPGLSGIELIKSAKEQGFKGKFIILTGHSDFEFAKSAISLGVRAYLLKPIDEDELINNINDIVKELDAKKDMDAFLSISELTAKKELLRRLLLSSSLRIEMEKEIKQYGLNFYYPKYCVAILSPKIKKHYIEDYANMEDQAYPKEIIGDLEKVYLEDKLVLIGKGYNYEQFEELLKQYNEKVRNVKGEGLFITIGHNVANWWDIYFSYECAKMLSNYQFLLEDKEIINIHMVECMDLIEDNETFDSQIVDFIEVGDTNEIKNIIANKKEYYQSRLLNESDIKVKITHSLNKIYTKLEKSYESKKEEMGHFDEVLKTIKDCCTLDEIMEGVLTYCLKISEVVKSASTDNVVKRMILYMEKNYEKDLKLESLSKVFSYNSAYLGKIFKKYTGDSFNNTLDIIRINNAKRLLNETDLKVYQVSEQVGYSNIDYFYSKFKKYVGISPKEFKNK